MTIFAAPKLKSSAMIQTDCCLTSRYSHNPYPALEIPELKKKGDLKGEWEVSYMLVLLYFSNLLFVATIENKIARKDGSLASWGVWGFLWKED